jgi:protein involved in sex pheromone biosynthesis
MLKRTLHISLLATSVILTACGGGEDDPAELLQTTRHSSVGDITAETYALTLTEPAAASVQ